MEKATPPAHDVEVEKGVFAAEPSESNDSISPEDNAKLKAVHKKTDLRLLLWYSFVYLIMRIDVGNITNTAIINLEQGHGIKKQLGGLTSGQWAWCLSIFYYPYMFFEPLSTLLLKKFSPSVWMFRIMVTWGIISMCQGATQNYGGLLATRFLLGAAEAGFYPGVLYHLSFWYPTDKMPWRIAFFYASGQFSGTVSGLLAYAISFMDGKGGLAGWRWVRYTAAAPYVSPLTQNHQVFILEGIPPILCGFYTYFFLPNYPETATFLNEEEKRVIIDNLPKTQPTMKAKTFNLQEVKMLLTDPTVISFGLLWITHGIGGWGVSFVLPTVIYELGLRDTAVSQLMTMPTYSFGFIILCTLGYLIHLGKLNPWLCAIGLELTSIVCYIILLTVKHSVVKYIFVMVATASSICVYPVIWPERIRAARGTTTAGLAIGLTNACAQLMGIVGPQVYQSKFGPSYHTSYAVSIGLLAACMVTILASWWLVVRGDRKRAAAASRPS